MNTLKLFFNETPLINKFSLNYVLDNTNNDFSLLMKSFFSFYYMVFSSSLMFERLTEVNCNNENYLQFLPWKKESEKMLWIPEFITNIQNSEDKIKTEVIWICLLSEWYRLLFCNPYFVIKYSRKNGYGLYARSNMQLDNNLLNNQMRHGTFMESITNVEYEVLKWCGFDSFIKIPESNKKKSNLYVLFGFWFFANSSRTSELFFSTGYEKEDFNEFDSLNRLGNHYRTIIETVTKTKVIIIKV